MLGRRGWIERYHGAFRNPEELAYLRDNSSYRGLYLVGFRMDVLRERHADTARDKIFVDVYDHWLEPLQEELHDA